MEWGAVALGLAVGAAASGLFFAGLGLGMRLALRTARPVNILVLSAVLRIAALLGTLWAMAVLFGPFALAGYAVAFLITRQVATTMARAGVPAGDAP